MNYLIIRKINTIFNYLLTSFNLISYISACYSVSSIKLHTLYNYFIINKLINIVNVFINFLNLFLS